MNNALLKCTPYDHANSKNKSGTKLEINETGSIQYKSSKPIDYLKAATGLTDTGISSLTGMRNNGIEWHCFSISKVLYITLHESPFPKWLMHSEPFIA